MHEKDCLSQRDLLWIVVLKGEMTQTQKFYIMQMLSIFGKSWSEQGIYIVCEFRVVSAREPDAWQGSRWGIELVKAVGRETMRQA